MKPIPAMAAMLAVMFLSGCTQSDNSQLANQPEIGISHQVLDGYNNGYLGRHMPEAFAVSESGGAYSYYYCDAGRCLGGNLNSTDGISRAIADCSHLGQGPCVLFAVGRSAPRKYHLID